jgi:adenosylhomocysteine nucleosidase
MLYLITALTAEARPIIDHLRLKRMDTAYRFEVYRSPDVILIRSGVGKILSAAAVSYLCALQKFSPSDVISQIGICGMPDSTVSIGQVMLINKITDHGSGRDYYPDIIIGHPFKETALVTHERPVRSLETNSRKNAVDMEASGFIEAAQVFSQSHQIACLKIVSDHLDFATLKPEAVSGLITEGLPEIIEYLNRLQTLIKSERPVLEINESQLILEIRSRFRLTETNYHRLLSAAKKFKVVKGNDISFLLDFLSRTTKTKIESNDILESILEKLGT